MKLYQLNIIYKIKKNYKKKFAKDIKIFLKKKKQKSSNMVVNVTKIFQKMKNPSLLSIEKNIIEREKTLYYNLEKKKKFDFQASLVTSGNVRSFFRVSGNIRTAFF